MATLVPDTAGAPPAAGVAVPATREWSAAFLSEFDTIIFDCDGVLWHETVPIPGAIEALRRIHALGKRLLFATNNSGKSRTQYAKKFADLGFTGFPLAPDQIFTSSNTTAHYIAHLPKEEFDPDTQKVFVVGEGGIALELRERGIQCIEAREMFGPNHLPRAELAQMELDPTIGCVVAGIDDQMTYTKCAYAAACLRQRKHFPVPPAAAAAPADVAASSVQDGPAPSESGSSLAPIEYKCLWISTNQDTTLPTEGHSLCGAGSCVDFVAAAAGRRPVNIGKPETHMLELACAKFHLDRSRVLMVGDRLNTDILFGLNGGIQTLFISETGVSRREDIQRQGIVPTFITTDVGKMTEEPTAGTAAAN